MKQNVNYIKHHKEANLKLIELDLNSTHISLYNALFFIWNECGFDTDLSVNRNDVMKLSKIGSANTYTKCLKELDKHNIIVYKPSYNPLVGSKIHLYRFDKGSGNGTDKGSGVSSSKGSGNGTATLSKLLNLETTKLINDNALALNTHLVNWLSSLENYLPSKKEASVFSDEVEDCYLECLKYFEEQLHPKNPNSWKDVIDKLNRIDKIPFEQIKKITQKTRADDFWSSNFLSMTKLRQKQKSSGLNYVVVFNEQIKKSNGKDTRTDREIASDRMERRAGKGFRFN